MDEKIEALAFLERKDPGGDDDVLARAKAIFTGRNDCPKGGCHVSFASSPSDGPTAYVYRDKHNEKAYRVVLPKDWSTQVGYTWGKARQFDCGGLSKIGIGPCGYGLAVAGWHFVLAAKRLDSIHAEGMPVWNLRVVHKGRGYALSVHTAFVVLCGWSWGFGWSIKGAIRSARREAAKQLGATFKK